jgi:hypothetical protein
MALPLTGIIKLSDIQAEYGGPSPARLKDYYLNGAYVKQNPQGTIPVAGQIRLRNFLGGAKGTKITQPELQLLDALGADKILVETMKVRGGDNGAYRAYTSSLENFGSANLDNIDRFSTGVQSSATLEAIFNSMMLDINLTKKTF